LDINGGKYVSEDEDLFVPVLEDKELQEGSMKRVTIEGIPILLVKVAGEIFAIDNRCPHMSCGFDGGSLDGDVIICPCHDWRFDLKTGEYEEDKNFKLTKYEWKIRGGKIWVKVEEDEE
jgi:nitrite reductase/ring-hydroxylating ferredoxin subunit